MNTLIEAYLDEKVDLKADLQQLMRNKDAFVNYRLTGDQLQFFLGKFIPSVFQHTQDADRRLVTGHYDRGNDFFEAFLGKCMVYTSGVFQSGSDGIETAQRRKIDAVAAKLQLKPNERLLDIGCGWGTLVGHMADRYGVDATGVTICKNQAELGTRRIAEKRLSSRARILTLDYRDIPQSTYDKICVLEMAEHVGIKRFQKFLRQLKGLLADEGLLFLQIAGLRRNWDAEDFTWAMFMSKYIFPGADASLPLSYVTNQLEKAGFEIHSVENIGIHYSYTIDGWYRNWTQNREQIVASYGERWFRLWYLFLGWSVLIAEQGRSPAFRLSPTRIWRHSIATGGLERNRWSRNSRFLPMSNRRWRPPVTRSPRRNPFTPHLPRPNPRRNKVGPPNPAAARIPSVPG